MNRMPVAERREQLIEAAMAVASRDGIDAATVRAVAAEAGVSLGVVHYCFQDKAELMRAMAHAITAQNTPADLSGVPEGAPVESVIEAVVSALWDSIHGARGAQLLSYELTTASLRQSELTEVALEQYQGQWAAAQAVLTEIGRVSDVSWAVPPAQLSRVVVAFVDGISLSWLVDGDDDAARSSIQGFGRFLASLTRPTDDDAADDEGAADDETAGPAGADARVQA
ncbi:TetR family transcriptional regulator [Cellulomonas sp. DKR-3]|uniref:TetR family transcriptional regulator n=1 Tax=Cellulomonas fulva TaxID=2835530 RepID=A0ABS5TVI8_9CELL|nr:TetR family transcriptional regulator [Cellulomonas fulva]MBT0993169.1 TetR family transcriptional regulator [Cellulomonas fulva]